MATERTGVRPAERRAPAGDGLSKAGARPSREVALAQGLAQDAPTAAIRSMRTPEPLSAAAQAA